MDVPIKLRHHRREELVGAVWVGAELYLSVFPSPLSETPWLQRTI